MLKEKDLKGKRFNKVVIESLTKVEGSFTIINCVCDCGNKFEASYSQLKKVKDPCGCSKVDKRIDKVGEKYNMLTISSIDESLSSNVIVSCECGNTKSVIFSSLILGNIKSCGCLTKQRDVVGEVYNRFTITENLPSIKYGKHSYKRVRAVCQCGNVRDLCYRDLVRGSIKACGCLANEIKTKVSEGEKYGLWTVLKETDGYFYKDEKAGRTFLCKCVCGKEKEVNLQSLKRGQSKSCGCQGIPPKEKIVKEKIIPINTEEEQWKECISYPGYYISTKGNVYNYKIQKYLTPKKSQFVTINGKEIQFLTIKEMYKTFIGEYNTELEYVALEGEEIKLESIYLKQKQTDFKKSLKSRYKLIEARCNNPLNKSYKSYGAKGIKLCKEWENFENFYGWFTEQSYDESLEIDRIDNTKGYSPDNCRLVTTEENKLRVGSINMSIEDVLWIRSDDFSWEEALNKFTCNRRVIERIKEGITFKNII